MTTSKIKQKLQVLANNNTKEIIMGVYQNMINSHNDFCGCNYCKILRQYVYLKKELSKCQTRLNGYEFFDDNQISGDLEYNVRLRKIIKELKQEKNSLKLFL